VALAVLLYFSGGTASPFIGLLLVFVAIAAASLRWLYSVCVTLLTVGCYALLDIFHVPLSQSAGGLHDFQVAAFSMCVNYAVGAALVAYFVSAIASLVRDQGRILAEARQREVNQDYLVRVGSLIAGAAHEIRSSLSTMAILVKDLPREGGNPARDLHLISEQIEACRRSLSDLMIGHDVAEPDSGARESVKVFLRGVLDRWVTLRPGARVALRWRGTQPPPVIPADRCLGQAILNLLDNAADSAPDKEVEMNCSWSLHHLRILIQDRGPGLQQSVACAEPGQRLLTTKGEKGTGIGLLLAKTAIQRFGGSLKLSNRSGGGARAQVILPLRSAPGGATQTRLWEFHLEEKHAKSDERSAESAARGR
jgi:two-component system sensor histidine kinase RegB